MADIQASLSKTSQVAETALETGLALQDESQAHQKDIADLKEKYIILAASQRENNFKFHEFDEEIEGSSDLTSFMGNWLASELNLEPKVFPSITKAYRMGAKKSQSFISQGHKPYFC